MIGTIIILLVLTASIYFYKSFRSKQKFAQHARSLGYRVFEHPYCWFGSAMYNGFKTQYEQYGDSNYLYKHEFSSYDLIVSNLIFQTMIELQSPELIKEFFMKENEGFYEKSHFGLGHLQRLISNQNLLLSEGDSWKSRRKIFSSVFNFSFITDKIPEIQQICKDSITSLILQKGNSNQIQCNIDQTLTTVFSTVILKCFFSGNELSHIGQEKTIFFVNSLLLKIAQIGRSKSGVFLGVNFAKMGITQKNRVINKRISLLRKVAKDFVMKRRKEIQKNKGFKGDKQTSNDIIQALTKINSVEISKNSSENTLTIESLTNEFLTFFLAGSQTTLSFTRMMIYRLAWHPQVLEKVLQQFEKEVKTEKVSYSQLKNLKYFEKVQRQTLRMDSSGGALFTRVVQKDHYLGNLKISKGMCIDVRLRGLHYKEQFYEKPNEFNPERWKDENMQKYSYSYLPFSAGARNCIGKYLALLENKIFMIELLRKFNNISVSKGEKETKMNIGTLYGPEPLLTKLKRSQP